MIEKIISGGQTGADRAALDVAIEMGISHGGWVPKGRKTEDGRLPSRYRMQETGAIDYSQRTELNVVDSQATLLFSRGALKGGSALTRRLAGKHNKPCLHIDLDELSGYKAVEIIKSWVEVRDIKILNVAGPRESEDPGIYDDVQDILRSLLYPPPEHITKSYPRTVQEAADRLIRLMPMKEKASIARMDEADASFPPLSLRMYILDQFGLRTGNEALLRSCRYMSHKYHLDTDEAVSLIILELHKKLRETHNLRRVK